MIERLFYKIGYTRIAKTVPIHFPYQKKINVADTVFDFWIVDETGKQWYEHDFWSEAMELKQLKKMISSGDNVMEIGVHHGFTACCISKCIGNDGRFIGVELSPKSAMIAQAQLKLNNFGTNCKIINAAAANKEGVINFNNLENGNAMINITTSTYSIKTITGDSLLNELKHVDVLKIDVEGFEVNVLQGCKNILSSLPKIALEIHLDSIPYYGASVNDIFKIIPLEKYSATYFWNPGTHYVRPDTHKLLEFELNKLPTTGIVNLFLIPK